jgi:hypothetical protein
MAPVGRAVGPDAAAQVGITPLCTGEQRVVPRCEAPAARPEGGGG